MSDEDVRINAEVPKTRWLVDSVLEKLASLSSEHLQQPPSTARRGPKSITRPFDQEAFRPYFLTLHLLFPHILLDALDLLDRNLVVRLCVQPTERQGTLAPNQGQEAQASRQYYVRSAQGGPRHRKNVIGMGAYQVHLTAWNCSCAAFAFAATVECASGINQACGPTHEIPTTIRPQLANTGEIYVGFGGLGSRLDSGDQLPPVCKHLLACTLAEACKGLFSVLPDPISGSEGGSDALRPGIVEYTVSPFEAAGWTAGQE